LPIFWWLFGWQQLAAWMCDRLQNIAEKSALLSSAQRLANARFQRLCSKRAVGASLTWRAEKCHVLSRRMSDKRLE
jgi:hypothetical protein